MDNNRYSWHRLGKLTEKLREDERKYWGRVTIRPTGRIGFSTATAQMVLRPWRVAWLTPLLAPGCSGPSPGVIVTVIALFGLVLVIVVGLAMFLYREIAALRERVAKAETRQNNRDSSD